MPTEAAMPSPSASIDRVIHRGRSGDVVAHDVDELRDIRDRDLTGREVADAIRREQVVHRLVDRAPFVDEIAEALGDERRVIRHRLDDLRAACRAEAAQVRVFRAAGAGVVTWIVDPHRIREVVQRDERTDAHRTQRLELGAIVRDRGLVDLTLDRLDARPLDREAIAVHAELRDEPDIGIDLRVALHGIADECSVGEPGRAGP